MKQSDWPYDAKAAVFNNRLHPAVSNLIIFGYLKRVLFAILMCA